MDFATIHSIDPPGRELRTTKSLKVGFVFRRSFVVAVNMSSASRFGLCLDRRLLGYGPFFVVEGTPFQASSEDTTGTQIVGSPNCDRICCCPCTTRDFARNALNNDWWTQVPISENACFSSCILRNRFSPKVSTTLMWREQPKLLDFDSPFGEFHMEGRCPRILGFGSTQTQRQWFLAQGCRIKGFSNHCDTFRHSPLYMGG